MPFPGASGTSPRFWLPSYHAVPSGPSGLLQESVVLQGCKEHHSSVTAKVLLTGAFAAIAVHRARHPPPSVGSGFTWQLTSSPGPANHRHRRLRASKCQPPSLCPEPWLQRSHPNWTCRLISCQVMNYAVMPGLQCSIDTISSSHFYMLLFAGALSRACRRTWKTFKAN